MIIKDTTTERIDIAGLHGERDASVVMACLTKAIKDALEQGAARPKLVFDCDDGRCIVSVEWVRPATEEELRLRRAQSAKYQAFEESRERAEYERLKKKFG